MDEIVVVGGLVPTLLIDQLDLPENAESHAGTMDLDLGLSLALVGQGRDKAVAQLLRRAGFQADLSSANGSRQTWERKGDWDITVDLLVPPSSEEDPGRKLRDWDEISAFVTPGLQLAFENQVKVPLSGQTLSGTNAEVSLRVCGPGAYVVLKTIAMRRRADNKDAYDLYYVLRNYGNGVQDVAAQFAPLLYDKRAREALSYLKEDFGESDAIGAHRVAMFVASGPNKTIQAEVSALAHAFFDEIVRLKESQE